ncbi:MAG: hypothetical protein CMM84_19610 [Rhodothermaceae bacterium]|nr:hypothetical protein [Rhodothermaceae bacterium]MBC12432.1 hypothetical protein [Rhodothermaceae bacterium]
MEAFREAKERFLERSTVEAGGQRFYVEAEREAFADSMSRAYPGNPVFVLPVDIVYLKWTPANWFGDIRRARVQLQSQMELDEDERRDVFVRADDLRSDGRYWRTTADAVRDLLP